VWALLGGGLISCVALPDGLEASFACVSVFVYLFVGACVFAWYARVFQPFRCLGLFTVLAWLSGVAFELFLSEQSTGEHRPLYACGVVCSVLLGAAASSHHQTHHETVDSNGDGAAGAPQLHQHHDVEQVRRLLGNVVGAAAVPTFRACHDASLCCELAANTPWQDKSFDLCGFLQVIVQLAFWKFVASGAERTLPRSVKLVIDAMEKAMKVLVRVRRIPARSTLCRCDVTTTTASHAPLPQRTRISGGTRPFRVAAPLPHTHRHTQTDRPKHNSTTQHRYAHPHAHHTGRPRLHRVPELHGRVAGAKLVQLRDRPLLEDEFWRAGGYVRALQHQCRHWGVPCWQPHWTASCIRGQRQQPRW
jgi:hypothetical protein